MPPLSVLPFGTSFGLSETVGEVAIDVLGLALGLALVLAERSAMINRQNVRSHPAPGTGHPRSEPASRTPLQ
jgi:hypothetical protein